MKMPFAIPSGLHERRLIIAPYRLRMDNGDAALGTKVTRFISHSVSSPVMFLRQILVPAVIGASLLACSCLAQTPQRTNGPATNAAVLQAAQQTITTEVVDVAKTRNGLGQGDFAHFPTQAHADLHLRSPYQNHHRRERVKLDDLFNHIDLFTFIVLRLDGTLVHLNPR